MAGAVEQQLTVGAVIEKEILVGVAATEVIAQKGKYMVFRADLRAENAAVIGKTNEAAKLLQLAGQMTDSLEKRETGIVRWAAYKLRPIGVELLDKPIQARLFICHTGVKSPVKQSGCTGREGGYAAHDPATVGKVGLDAANGIEGKNGKFLIAGKGNGEFFIDVAFINAAKKSLKAAVVFVYHIDPGHYSSPRGIKER